MSPRPDVSDERKKQILNAAEQVFTKKAWTSRASMIRGRNRPKQRHVVPVFLRARKNWSIAILDRIFQGLFKQMEQRKDNELSAAEAISQFTEEAIRDYKIMLRLMPVALNSWPWHSATPPFRKRLNNIFIITCRRWCRMIQRGLIRRVRPVDAREAAISGGRHLRRHHSAVGLR